jgi:hypothetical protein
MFEDLDLKIDSANNTPATTTKISVNYWCSNVTVQGSICGIIWTGTVGIY